MHNPYTNAMKAIVLGATGLVGGKVVKTLLKMENIEEIFLPTRRRTPFNKFPKTTEILTDFKDLGPLKDELNADILFCCLGATIKKAGSKEAFKHVDYDLPLNFAKLLRPKTFALISAIGASASSFFFYNKVKGQLEDELRALALDRLVIIRPSLLLGAREEERLGEDLAKAILPKLSFLLPPSKRPVQASEVARVMVDLALKKAPQTYVQTKVFTKEA